MIDLEAAEPASAAADSRRLGEREEGYLKLLRSLRASGDGGEIGVVRRIASWIDSRRCVVFIASHRPWFDDWVVKEAFVRNDVVPEEVRSRCAQAVGVIDLLRELDRPDLETWERDEIKEHARSLIRALPVEDREVVKARALELSSSRRGGEAGGDDDAGAAVDRAAAAIEAGTHDTRVLETESPDAELPPGTSAELPPTPDDTQPLRLGPELRLDVPLEPDGPASAEGAQDSPGVAALFAQREEARVEQARTTEELAVLEILSRDESEEVRLALLENPRVGDRVVANVARTATPRIAREIYRNRNLFQRPMVRSALLECPHVPSAALVEVVSSMGDLRGLLGLVQSPHVRSLEVKARARARLTALFRGLGSAEKLATVRRNGRSLLKALWTDFFRDEELVLRCLQERQVDPGLVVEIARSSIAPRRALQTIGENAKLCANYQVRLALVRNPKTPRPMAQRLYRTLRSADRERLGADPNRPAGS